MDIAVGCRLGRMLGIALLLAVVGLFLLTEPAAATTYTVNDLGDASDQTPGDDVCLTAGGVCTLRAAIQEANAHAGPDAIHFNIPGPVPSILSPATLLPSITGTVTIDGLTQGNIACPLPTGSLTIQIDGGDSLPVGLIVQNGAIDSSIRGLSITNFAAVGISILPDSTTLTCNAVGVQAAVQSDSGTNGNGIGVNLAGSGAGQTVGGLNGGDGNVIGNNDIYGVSVGGVGGHRIQGNNVRNNGRYGVRVTSYTNTIERNTIHNNARAGVAVAGGGTGNRVTQNSIVGNGGLTPTVLGIDLGDDGVTANDPGDTDTGSNNLQNFPILTGAGTTATNTAVTGTLDSVAGETYRIEFFRNTTCDASGYGEGAEYLGFVNVAIDASNPTGIFSIGSLPATTVGHRITATATRTSPPFDTSEFSACAPIVADAVQPGPTLTVTTNADIDDGVCSTLHCSLREAILHANALPTDDTIEFDIPGPAPHVITIAGSLPPITDKVTINGLSQGDIACPLPTGPLTVQLAGSGAGGAPALGLSGADGSSIRGLSITGFDIGISVASGSNYSITCNYIGLAADGSTAQGNGDGIFLLFASASNVTIGGPNADDGNVIAFSTRTGVLSLGGGNNTLQGNTFRNNGLPSILLVSSNNTISDNVIRNNNQNGVVLQGNDNTVSGNAIRENGFNGVVLQGNNNTAFINTIRDNVGDGITIGGGTGNRVSQNSLVNNGTTAGSLGIDIQAGLPGGGVTPNDPGDGDAGPNNIQNFPVLARASTNGANTIVVGVLDSVAGSAYTIEFFSTPTCDPSGHGEGQVFLGSTTVTIAGPDTTVPFSVTLPAVALGQVVTATATRNTAPLDTSEFSACRAVTPPPGVTVTESGGTAVAEGSTTDTFQVRLNAPPTVNLTIQLASSPAGQLQPIADLVFTPANWNVDQTVTVVAVDDAAAEGPHAATIGVTAVSTDPGYTGLVIPSVNVAITDNDTPGFTITPTGGLTTTEAGGTATFTVRLNSVPSAPVTIALTSSDTTEGTVNPASLTFAADATAFTPQTVTVTGQQDTLADGPVAYTIVTGVATSADPNYNGLNPDDVALTNTDDELPAGLAINDASAAEGDTGTPTLTFTVTLTPPSAQVVTVQFATANGPAPTGATGGPACAAGVDFVTTSGTLTFQPTETAKPIAVTLCPDAEVEGDEVLLVNLSGAVNSTIGDGQGQGTIRNDDVAGGLSFSAGTVSVPEAAGSVVITVQRSGGAGPNATQATTSAQSGSVASGSVRPSPPTGPSPSAPGTVAPSALAPVTVSFATADQTATAGQDYIAVAGTLVFGANETTKTITIPIVADSLQEGPESFLVTLSGPTGGAGLGAQATITVVIVDTSHGSSPPPGDDSADDERVERERETEEERRQRARTNRGNRDDDAVEGDVIEVRCDQPWPAVVIANRDGLVEVRLIKEAQAACTSISVGDYLEADGDKQHEGLFYADSVEIKRRR